MNKPGYTANSEVNRLVARLDRMQEGVNNCNALLIERALELINEGNKERGIEILKGLRDILRDVEETQGATT
jgi:hypothetical protein